MEQDIYIETIHLDREHLRQDVTDESVRMLGESIIAHGLLQAIVVAPREGGGYRLIAGRRRLTAAKLIGWTTIPARIIEPSSHDELPAIAENLMRLQMNVVEEAEALRMLQEKKGMSIREIAETTNHGTSWVQDRLSVIGMPQNFKAALAKKAITIGAANLLLQIGDEEYRDYLLKIAEVNGATVNQCQGWLLDYQARSKLLNPTGENGVIPRLPFEAPEPMHQCELCDGRVKISATTLQRICYPCAETLHQAATNTPAFETGPKIAEQTTA